MKKLIPLLLLWCCASAHAQEPPVNLCKEGFLQSPISIDFVEEVSLPPLKFLYKNSVMKFKNGSPINLYAVPSDQQQLDIDGVRYTLMNVHAHTPSEHRAGGKQFPIEIHFVHQSFEGNQLIVAQWVRIGRSNPALDTLIENFALGKKKQENTQLTFGLDPRDLLAPFLSYYTYQGSEITPPCTENVTWFIIKDTIEVGTAQVAALRQLLGSQNREPQPLNARKIMSSMN